MGEGGYKIRDQQAIHFITFAVVEWVDVFTKQVYRDIILDSLRFCQRKKGLVIYSWVIMSNHVHFILSAREGFNLSNILRDFKKYTSVNIMQAIKDNEQESRRERMLSIFRKVGKSNSRNERNQFWRQDNQPKELDSNIMMDQKLNYIHDNRVKAGIVELPENYVHNSAKDYAGEKGLLEIAFLD
ncbi:MAG: transposase [Bacteroidetes bacterium]|nr:transposase [Bacteroidota bacterium]